jgi:hypothetical protein
LSGHSIVEFSFLDIDVEIVCQTKCEQVSDLLAFCFSGLAKPSQRCRALSGSVETLRYRVARDPAESELKGPPPASYLLEAPTGETYPADDEGALLFLFEKDLTTRSQRIRSDLLFLHAAALGREGQAVLLVGDPGSGKSTLTFALLECGGIAYLSDELAPVELDTLSVSPYPRALWLKQPPSTPWKLPPANRRSSRGIHVPCAALGAEPAPQALPLGALFLMEPGVAARQDPSLWRISAAEATTRLFGNFLNPLGHPSAGLDAALAVASAVPCFALRPAGLEATRSLLLAALD